MPSRWGWLQSVQVRGMRASAAILPASLGTFQARVPHTCQLIAFLAFLAVLADWIFSKFRLISGAFIFESHQVHQNISNTYN